MTTMFADQRQEKLSKIDELLQDLGRADDPRAHDRIHKQLGILRNEVEVINQQANESVRRDRAALQERGVAQRTALCASTAANNRAALAALAGVEAAIR